MRPIIMMAALLAVMVLLAACGGADQASSDDEPFDGGVPDGFAGQWECEDLASDGETDTSFYAMRIEEDGTFSMYDEGAGNPGISGTMGNPTDSTVDCRFDMEEFYVPFCWDIDGENATFSYELDQDTLRLGHNDVYMTFHRAIDPAQDLPVPDPLDSLLTFTLPSGFHLEMEYPYTGEEGFPIVQKGYGSEQDGYFTVGVFSFEGHDCLGDVTAMIDYEEFVNTLDHKKEIVIGGEDGWYGTYGSDDMPDMAADAYVQHGDYVFEFRLTNADDQVTEEQMEEFERILETVAFL